MHGVIMATGPHISAKNKTDVLQEGLHAGSEGGAGFPSRGSRSTGGRASRTTLTQTSCVKGGTHSKNHCAAKCDYTMAGLRAHLEEGFEKVTPETCRAAIADMRREEDRYWQEDMEESEE